MSETEYTIRPFEDRDRKGFFRLFEHTFGQKKSDEWFEWKYVDNPYVDHVPMYVAELEGELVGARPFFALPIAREGWIGLALQPGDTMVHADHRGQGLFTRMTEAALETYVDSDVDLIFNFPNAKSGPGYRKMGWEVVDRIREFIRV
ncbi:MAG: GNAT family N-acetyltransferase, partial [Halobacteriota archaeon]